jgi:hypothetical protein
MLTSEQQLANRFAIALKDMDNAEQYLEALLELSQEQEKLSDSRYFYHCEAIRIAAVISYCRCFKHSNSAESAKNKLNDSNFSFFNLRPDLLDLHKHILNLRDKSIAHADWEFHNSEQINTNSDTGVHRDTSIPDYGHQLNIEKFKELIDEVTKTCKANIYDIGSSYKSK